MSKIYTPSKGPIDWKELLSDPEGQWKVGRSAYELAHCWEKEPGDFPISFRKVFRKSDYSIFHNVKLLFAYPEFKVRLDTARAPSHNDVFALAMSDSRLISIAVEGKAGEDFDRQIMDWLDTKGKPSGRPDRLEFLCKKLGLKIPIPGYIRYQLLHRTASSLIEAEKYGAKYAIMIVQNFDSELPHFDDYSNFAQLLGLKINMSKKVDSIVYVKNINDIELYLAWINSF